MYHGCLHISKDIKYVQFFTYQLYFNKAGTYQPYYLYIYIYISDIYVNIWYIYPHNRGGDGNKETQKGVHLYYIKILFKNNKTTI